VMQRRGTVSPTKAVSALRTRNADLCHVSCSLVVGPVSPKSRVCGLAKGKGQLIGLTGLGGCAAASRTIRLRRRYSVRRSSAAGVRAAIRPGIAATRLPSTNAPITMATVEITPTVGLGTT
jgi:hypothetical protein